MRPDRVLRPRRGSRARFAPMTRDFGAGVVRRASRVTGASRTPGVRAMCGVVLAIVAASAAPPAPAAAAKLTATPVEVRHALFVAGDVDRMSRGARATRKIVLERLLQRMYVIAPTLESGTAGTAGRRLPGGPPPPVPGPGGPPGAAPDRGGPAGP